MLGIYCFSFQALKLFSTQIMNQQLNELIDEYFRIHEKKVNFGFKRYLQLYTEQSMEMRITSNDVLNITRLCKLNLNLDEFNPVEQKLIYIFCKLKFLQRKRTKLIQNKTIPLRKIALGMENIQKYEYSFEINEILLIIYNNSNFYKKFKEISEGLTMSHLHFLKVVKDQIRNYELHVLTLKENDILEFYVNVKPFFKFFSLFNQINEHFIETRNPYSFLRIYHRDFSKSGNSILSEIIKNCTLQLNENLNKWLLKGEFTDYAKEFFISQNSESFWHSFDLEPEMIPFFISEMTARKILYIGKVSKLFTYIESHFDTMIDGQTKSLSVIQSLQNMSHLDILENQFHILIDERIKIVNNHLKTIFLEQCEINNYFLFCKNTFFFARNDFIENLFFYMKDMYKSAFCKRSYSFILDNALQASFGELNHFSSSLDMCVLKQDDFSIFYRLEFPINVVIEKDVILIFSSIFKYFWKIKKIERFLEKLKIKKNMTLMNTILINKWYIFIQKLLFYSFFEVIEEQFATFFLILQNNQIFLIDELRKGIKNLLKSVILRIFQENHSGKEEMDALLSAIEQECYNFKKHMTIFDDKHIQSCFSKLFTNSKVILEKTSLYNIVTLF